MKQQYHLEMWTHEQMCREVDKFIANTDYGLVIAELKSSSHFRIEHMFATQLFEFIRDSLTEDPGRH
jgi:hypothetical protein